MERIKQQFKNLAILYDYDVMKDHECFVSAKQNIRPIVTVSKNGFVIQLYVYETEHILVYYEDKFGSGNDYVEEWLKDYRWKEHLNSI